MQFPDWTWRIGAKESVYLVKCILVASICYSFFFILPDFPIQWSLISAVIVLSPDNDSQLAYNRIKSNVLGGLIGFGLYFLPLPNMALVIIGISLTIIIGYFLRAENTVRSAMAAVIIVLVENPNEKDWNIPLERIVCVLVGCFVSLMITYIFSFLIKRLQQ